MVECRLVGEEDEEARSGSGGREDAPPHQAPPDPVARIKALTERLLCAVQVPDTQQCRRVELPGPRRAVEHERCGRRRLVRCCASGQHASTPNSGRDCNRGTVSNAPRAAAGDG
jgi:hypothetical protein